MMKKIEIQDKKSEKRFFRILYTLFSASSLCFAARILLTTAIVGKDAVIGIAITAVFVALFLFFAYTAFIRKDGFQRSAMMTKLEYAAFAIIILQMILTLTDLPS
ncbi:MAG: hypothetical protein PHY15_08785 [Eubacteriales bacterium]|nr:hypothetical protein [Eubacteriales bacterium]MDD4475729.1 hypothetical protein [Eubacteriales bacterium]